MQSKRPSVSFTISSVHSRESCCFCHKDVDLEQPRVAHGVNNSVSVLVYQPCLESALCLMPEHQSSGKLMAMVEGTLRQTRGEVSTLLFALGVCHKKSKKAKEAKKNVVRAEVQKASGLPKGYSRSSEQHPAVVRTERVGVSPKGNKEKRFLKACFKKLLKS